jgi:hypothetical protein
MLLVFFVAKKLSNYPGTSLSMTAQYLPSLAHFASISLQLYLSTWILNCTSTSALMLTSTHTQAPQMTCVPWNGHNGHTEHSNFISHATDLLHSFLAWPCGKTTSSIKVLVTFAFLCLWIDCTSGLIEGCKEQASPPL